jgi:hypothetical protein
MSDDTTFVAPLEMKQLIALLLVAGGPRDIETRSPAPLHEVIHAATKHGELHASDLALPEVRTRHWPDVGIVVEGVGTALHDLADDGILTAEDTPNRGVVLRVEQGRLHEAYLRLLMTMTPAAAAEAYRLGTSWRARCAIASKIASKAFASFAAISQSPPAKRRNGPLLRVC